jgi:GNAT superfamily N-acetyltransferase
MGERRSDPTGRAGDLPGDARLAADIAIRPLDAAHGTPTSALLSDLRVSLFGIQSRRLHDTLVADAQRHRIDCRIAIRADAVCGVVLAAPRSYWYWALAAHPALALACLGARLRRPRRVDHAVPRRVNGEARTDAPSSADGNTAQAFETGPPPRTWADPGDAWRIIIVGIAPAARGHGVAATLYRALMRDHSLVARIAADNAASIRLHRSVGWRLYPDGDVVLAVHVKRSEV